MTASFGSQVAEPDAPMQFLETENKNTIQKPDREGLVLKSALSVIQSTQHKQTPGLGVLRCSSMELISTHAECAVFSQLPAKFHKLH